MIVIILTLFLIDVPMISVLYHAAGLKSAVGAAVVLNAAAAEAVCRIIGRPDGPMTTLLALARALLAPRGGADGGASPALR